MDAEERQATALEETFGALLSQLAHYDSMLQVVLERLVIIQSDLEGRSTEEIWRNVEEKRNQVREATLERILRTAGVTSEED